MEAFELTDLSFTYPEAKKKALDGVTLSVHPGEFFVICGPSGSGKSTLLRQLKTVLQPHGAREGEIRFMGRALDSVDRREQSARIGFVGQSPENQMVTDKVWHELAFGLESMGYDTPTIRGRVAEMASFFGIQAWFYKNVTELSGGQKQLLNLASVMAMQPSVLILDEPTSQLDPIAASDFLAVLGKINRELGTTVILTEHRLEEAFPLASRVAVMDQGRLLCTETPASVGAQLKDAGHAMFLSMPTAMRVWAAVKNDLPCPVTVRDGRGWLAEYAASHGLAEFPDPPRPAASGDITISLSEIWFRYEKTLPDVVRGLSLSVHKGEFLAVLGGNGAGKTTLLSVIGGLRSVYRGEVKISGSVGILPQNPQTLFVKKTVREDLFEIFQDGRIPKETQEEKVARAVTICHLEELLNRHPYDLSGGEQQRAAMAKVLLLDPDILLMDEPTKGMDGSFKQIFAGIVKTLQVRGVTVLMVSHDVEFCAEYTDRCALVFDGVIVTEGPPRAFFSGNSFYTTSANRMARDLLPEAVTAANVIAACGGDPPPRLELPQRTPPLPAPVEESAAVKPRKLPWWRKLGALLSGGISLYLFLGFMRTVEVEQLADLNGVTAMSQTQMARSLVFCAALLVFAACITRRRPGHPTQAPREKRKLARRTLAATGLILLLIPLTLFVGETYLEGKKYYFISLLVLLECMLPFFLIFESRRPQARELVIIAVLCAIGVAGRAVFFMLPQFKPVMALTIIAGVAFGGETGFLVGAMTMLASNVLFSQGPWTPWQMFSMGVIGFLAGLLFRKGFLRRTRNSLCVFGALSALLIYGGIMNPASALMWANELNWKILLTYYISGFPMDCIHAAATGLFLWFAAEPMLEKLNRVKVKYGMVE